MYVKHFELKSELCQQRRNNRPQILAFQKERKKKDKAEERREERGERESEGEWKRKDCMECSCMNCK